MNPSIEDARKGVTLYDSHRLIMLLAAEVLSIWQSSSKERRKGHGRPVFLTFIQIKPPFEKECLLLLSLRLQVPGVSLPVLLLYTSIERSIPLKVYILNQDRRYH